MEPLLTTLKQQNCELVIKYHNKVTSPLIMNDKIYCAAQNGDILKIDQNKKVQILFTILGQPSSLAYRDLEEFFIISDFAHQSIFSREETKNQQIHNLITDFNHRPFLGPNTIKVGSLTNNLYFTDSGSFLETSIESKQGSVFIYHFDNQNVSCLAFRTLAYPSGLQMDEQQKSLIVSQTGQNRLLKFQINEFETGNFSVFHQFSGRVGPTTICRFENIFYVALFQFEELSNFGSVAVINNSGEMIEKLCIPIGPEITGLCIQEEALANQCSTIYVSQSNKIYKITLKSETDFKMGDNSLKSQIL